MFSSFNTIQDDIDLKHNSITKSSLSGFNTIQDDIDLKHMFEVIPKDEVLIPFKMT